MIDWRELPSRTSKELWCVVAQVRKRAIPSVGGGSASRVVEEVRNKASKALISRTVTTSKEPAAPHLQGTQVTESESHPEWKRRRGVGGFTSDVGGKFTTTKRYSIAPTGTVEFATPWQPVGTTPNEYRDLYSGGTQLDECQVASYAPWPVAAASTDAALNAFGTTAIAKCAPAEPTVNLAAALLEAYRDGLPKLIGRSTWQERIYKAQELRREAKLAGDEFLNAEFGWLPLISDVTDFVGTVIHMDKLLQQYIRDNGQMVRRRFSFPPESSVVETTTRSNVYPRLGTLGGTLFDFSKMPKAVVVRRRETTVDRWFSGAFVYHLPQTFFAGLYTPFAADFQVARRLLGIDLTPDVLWELTPWSWAVDWFTNAGDVIHNAGAWANHGLVMKYGYIMEHSMVRDTYTFVGPTNQLGGGDSARPHPLIMTSESKLRRVANPFGFGLTMDALSGVQKSILAALGLTRLR